MIRLAGVTVQYGSLTALNSVSVEFRKGEFTVLLGRSGAGKSTLLRCLNYLQVPTHGEVRVEGIGSLREKRNLRRHRRATGTIFQLHHLIASQTALQNVLAGRLGYHSTWRSLFPLPRADVDLALECLERVGLLHKSLARVDQLSGGERQRVGIARSLCQQPAVILADEPVASLDPATADEVMSYLCRVCREAGVTLVMSLHQVELARRFGDRIIGLVQGTLGFDGPPAALTEAHLQSIYETPDACPTSPNPEPDDRRRKERTANHDEPSLLA